MTDIDSKFAYLIVTLGFLVLWVILYLHRKDLRREMLSMSLFMAIGGLILEYYLWTVDWWSPETITGTKVGVEDFLLGFTNGGIAAVIYEEMFKRRFIKKYANHRLNAALLVLVGVVVMYLLFNFYSLSSFWATTIGVLVMCVGLISLRRDLFFQAITSGLLMMVLSLPFYWLVIFIFPGIVDQVWMTENLLGINVIGIPIEDLVFYFLLGFIAGPLYEYWKGYRLVVLTDTKR